MGTRSDPPAAKRQESPRETAERIVRDVDSYGDPCIYALAEDYLQLRRAVGDAIRAMPAVSATYEAHEILSKAQPFRHHGLRRSRGEHPELL